MKYQDILKLTLTKEEIIEAITKAKKQNYIDNLRDRHVNVQFDSKLRGYIGEIALKKWFIENNIKIYTTNCQSSHKSCFQGGDVQGIQS